MDAVSGPGAAYAKALAEVAEEAGELSDVTRDLALAREALTQRELRLFLANPLVPRAAKLELVEKLFAGRTTKTFLSLLRVVIARRRAARLREIIAACRAECLARRGILPAVVTTAVALPPETAEMVRRRLAAVMGREVEAEFRVDPRLLGGIVIRAGDELLDGSVLGIIDRLSVLLTTGSPPGRE
ncbi:MAG: ATP synthase F1 subunit delta [Bacteroidota bacterium]